MVRVKKLLVGTLNPRNHTTQISEINAIIKSLNKLTKLSVPKMKAIIS
ncbi:hypothetical protein [Candidatus Enterovibrio altilux]|uniref:Mobile element protein n=1 Tax=Candidatus Enterovibrio altilux TaxID=1927128 RepID=A0A291B796_9GAMM|nr:hypothetical protein [Candidatus Enterovibrio luxaltus]ATF08874.1 Mobile element protein [Candidatus Enterovibrio luxaltus]